MTVAPDQAEPRVAPGVRTGGDALAQRRAGRRSRQLGLGAAGSVLLVGLLLTFLPAARYEATSTMVLLPPTQARSAAGTASFYQSLFGGEVVTGDRDTVQAIAADARPGGCTVSVTVAPGTSALTIASRCRTPEAASQATALVRDRSVREVNAQPYVLAPSDGPAAPPATPVPRRREVGLLLSVLAAAAVGLGATQAAWFAYAASLRPVSSA